MSLDSTPCDNALFAVIANKITHDSLSLFTTYLEISQADFTQIKNTNRDNHKDQVIGILYKWKTKNGEGATYSALIQVYQQMENQEAVELIEGHYKKNHSSNPPLASGTDLKPPISKDAVAKPPKWDKKLPKETRREQFSTELVKDIKVLLMTATKDPEEDEVLRYLEPRDEDNKVIKTRIDSDSGIVLHIGKYGENPVIVVKSAESKCKQGSVHAAIVLSIILRECKSIKYVISVGVCFGMKNDQSFAGIIISDKVCDFTIKREGNDKYDSYYRGPHFTVRSAILSRFDEMSLTLPTEPKYEVKVQKGPFISSNNLVNNPEFKAGMLDERRDALAAEMEGAGIMSATNYASSVDAVIIKAIGDWGDGSKDHCREWKPIAARAAAYYVKEMLSAETFD